MSASAAIPVLGVGIDTARHGHRVQFMRPDRQRAAPPLTILENAAGYENLRQRLAELHQQHPQARFNIRLDAAGQYANNLERFLRQLPWPMTLSIGEPKRNKDYHKAHFPKRTSDDTESTAMARFAVVEQPPATQAVPEAFGQLQEIAGRLQSQVKQSTRAINRLHNLLARVFPELSSLAPDFGAGWVLRLLSDYPSADKIGRARLESLKQIPYLPKKRAAAIHVAAQNSVGSLRGAIAEALVRDAVTEVRHCQASENNLRELLIETHAGLPAGGHRQLATIAGVGPSTAAILTAKIIDIDRFATPNHLVSFFGVFPEEDSSGVDPFGQPLPPGTLRMSRKGNDLVRSYLWLAAKTGISKNPALRALYRRQRSKGKRGDVALGHCMRKLLHLVFAVWKTNRPFNPRHFAWEPDVPPTAPSSAPTTNPGSTTAATTVVAVQVLSPTVNEEGIEAVGHTRESNPQEQVVTTARSSLDLPMAAVNSQTEHLTTAAGPQTAKPAQVLSSAPPAQPAASAPPQPVAPVACPVASIGQGTTCSSPAPASASRGRIDFPWIKQQVTMLQVLAHLGILARFRGTGQQLRGPCPVHAETDARRRTCSVHVGKNIFQCFQANCAAHGNVLDLWAAIHHLPPYEAAQHLAECLQLAKNREEEPVREPVRVQAHCSPPACSTGAVITADGT